MHVSPPTAYTPELVNFGIRLLREIYQPGFRYKKAGVLLMDLQAEREGPEDLFAPAYVSSKRQHLMRVLDTWNTGTNLGKVLFASEGLGKPWFVRQTRKSRRFTTRWDELLVV